MIVGLCVCKQFVLTDARSFEILLTFLIKCHKLLYFGCKLEVIPVGRRLELSYTKD